MRMHLPGLVHLPVSRTYMACAFTQKIVKLSQMLLDLGHEVFLYGAEGSDAPCTKFIQTHTLQELRDAWGDSDGKGDLGYNWGKDGFRHDFNTARKPVTLKFYKNCIREINSRKKPDDFLLLMQGVYHKPIADKVGLFLTCEPGIGYRGSYSRFRAFESAYLMNFTYGSQNPFKSIDGHFYDRVIPNYFDPKDFTYNPNKKDYFLFVGRLITRKGLKIAHMVSQHLGKKLVIAGQGMKSWDGLTLVGEDITISGNVDYRGCVGPEERDKLMGEAAAVFVPTLYMEAFGGVNVEAQLCFPYDTLVLAKDIEKTYSRSFTGDLYTIVVDDNSIKCTPEHPFLTQRGWVKASSLCKTDILVGRKNNGTKKVEQQRIGDVVKRISEQIGKKVGKNLGKNSGLGKIQNSKNGSEIWKTPKFYTSRRSDYSEVLSRRRNKNSKNVGTSPRCSAKESVEIGGKISLCAKTLLRERKSIVKGTILGIGRDRNVKNIGTRPPLYQTSSNEDEVVFPNEIKAKDLSGHNEQRRIGLLGRVYRRRRNDLTSSYEKRRKAGNAPDKYIHVTHQMGAEANSENECNSVFTTTTTYARAKTPISDNSHIGNCRIYTSEFVSSGGSLLGNKEANYRSFVGVDGSPSIADTIGISILEDAELKSNDSIYEFKTISSIRKRKVEDLPVYNLGTKTGTYEANGLVVHNCGSAVITTSHGVFPETVVDGVTGFTCYTFDDFVKAAIAAPKLDTQTIRTHAERYLMDNVALEFDRWFKDLYKVWESSIDEDKKGWSFTNIPEKNKKDPTQQVWIKAQKWEHEWWRDYTAECTNTVEEDVKQLQYAGTMELSVEKTVGRWINLGGKSVLDIGGGPTSMLLKTRNGNKRIVVDPMILIPWVSMRYKASGIDFYQSKGEDLLEIIDDIGHIDEIWIYNLLQHVENPEKIIKNARIICPRIRIFEWINTSSNIGHPHILTQSKLDKWFDKRGTIGKFNNAETGLFGKYYSGNFRY